MIDLFKGYFSYVKRPITFFFLLSLSLLSFSQRGITNKSHPFQVLFVKDVTAFGKEVKQYDYISNSFLLNVIGGITLFHYSGKVIELSTGRYWTDDLITKKSNHSISRPLINPMDSTRSDVASRAPFCRLPIPIIDLVIPNEEKIDFYWNEEIELGWLLTEEENYKLYKSFIVEFSNIYGEVLKTVEVNGNLFSFKADTIGLSAKDTVSFGVGLLLVSIKANNSEDFETGEFGVRFHNLDSKLQIEHIDENYNGLLDAIYYDYINENRRSNFLYREQVRNSNQDPRFIKLYEDFLERNPQFK